MIIKNGASSLGKEFIKNRIQEIQKTYENEIAPFQNENSKYSHYVRRGFSGVFFTLHQSAIGVENNLYIKNLLHEYFSSSINAFKPDLNTLDYEKINDIIKNDSYAKKILDKQINDFCQDLTRQNKINTQNACLSYDEAWQEIKALQQNISSEQTLGYIYTNGVNTGREHFEILLITKDEIIKPLNWPDMVEKQISELPGEFISETKINSSSILTTTRVKLPHPQADRYACGTLGFLYLKELLQDDSRQLKKFTLSFSIFDKASKFGFFFPSPQVLRYSQSNTYNKIICAMLENSNSPQSVNKFQVVTLKKLLEDSIQKAKEVDDTSVVEQNKKILEQLPQFREKWIAVYHVMKQKRDAMQEKEEPNDYLAYSTHSLGDRASFFKEKSKSVGLNPMEELLTNTVSASGNKLISTSSSSVTSYNK